LKKAAKANIMNYKIIGNGTGIYCPSPDEDVSLKGFLKDGLLKVVKPFSVVVASFFSFLYTEMAYPSAFVRYGLSK
jgi:hypothetical protein